MSVCDEVLKDNKSEVSKAVSWTREHRRETSFALCKVDGEIEAGPVKRGGEKRAEAGECKEGEKIGNFHTHPAKKEGVSEHFLIPSVHDLASAIDRGSKFTCVGVPTKEGRKSGVKQERGMIFECADLGEGGLRRKINKLENAVEERSEEQESLDPDYGRIRRLNEEIFNLKDDVRRGMCGEFIGD